MNSVNYNYEHIGPKTAGQDFDIPVAYGGAFSWDFPAQIEAPSTVPSNDLFKLIRGNHGDIMFSIGG